MSSHTVSVIIPSRNVKEDLRKCLTSVFDNCGDGEVEVIVSDSNSTDGTVEMVQASFPHVKLCRSEEAGSYASAVNRGIEASAGEFLLFLDSDVTIREKTIGEQLNFLKACPETGAVVNKMLYPDGSAQPVVKRFPSVLNSLFGRETILTRLCPRNRISRNYLMLDELEKDEPFEADWASTACMMVRREAIEQIGFLDEGYLLYWVDADFCRRLRDAGYRVCYTPYATAVHDMRNEVGKKKSVHMIKAFHLGAYRYFRKFHVKSALHPMNLLAIVGLTARAALQILINSFKRD